MINKLNELFWWQWIVSSAKLSGTTAFFKPDPYVEISVDGGPPNKTDYNKSTYNPKWDEIFPLYVFYYFSINYLLFSYSNNLS
jgi:Ca2+-dependent lipid-binding protein